jgi:hypothetical protein
MAAAQSGGGDVAGVHLGEVGAAVGEEPEQRSTGVGLGGVGVTLGRQGD